MTPLVLILTFVFVMLLAAVNFLAELARDLMMMQQNSYRPDRYMRWLRSSGDTTSYPRLVGMCVMLVSLVSFNTDVWAMALIGLFSAGSAITLLRKKYKKPLVWTNRVKRIYTVMVLIGAAVAAVAYAIACRQNMLHGIYFVSVVFLA